MTSSAAGDGPVRASRTAVIVCQGRAAADGLVAPGRFADPVAAQLLRPDELVPVRLVRDGVVPAEWAARVDCETVRAAAEVLVPRTVAVDDAVRGRPAPQVVVLGAGLDARAWRMPELAGAAVFEVDHPASQQDKRARMGDRPRRCGSLAYVPADLTRDDLAPALAAAGHRPDLPTTWVWEGVLAYLRSLDVATTAAAVGGLSAPGSLLVVSYQAPGVSPVATRFVARGRSALVRRPSPWQEEPHRSSWTPAALRGLLAGNGYTVTTDEDLLTVAERLAAPVRRRAWLRTLRVATATC